MYAERVHYVRLMERYELAFDSLSFFSFRFFSLRGWGKAEGPLSCGPSYSVTPVEAVWEGVSATIRA